MVTLIRLALLHPSAVLKVSNGNSTHLLCRDKYINNKHEITLELQNKYHNTLLRCRQFNLK